MTQARWWAARRAETTGNPTGTVSRSAKVSARQLVNPSETVSPTP
jgi:hypothetical protein